MHDERHAFPWGRPRGGLSSGSCRSPPASACSATTAGSASASSRARTRRAAARSPARSSSPACSSTTTALRGHRVRPLALLNDSKQVEPDERERLYHAVVAAASRISVRVIAAAEIDRDGLHRSNLWGLRTVLADLHPLADACLVDGFRLGPLAPPHRAVVDGDTKSAAIAAASIVAKVTRDRLMRRLDALYPRYGFSSHVGYITPGHTRAVRGARPVPTAPPLVPGTRVRGARRRVNRGERLAARHYRLRGYRILGTNVRAGGYELDLIARRGRRLVFVEVKERARQSYGGGVGRRQPREATTRASRRGVLAPGASRVGEPRDPLRGRGGDGRTRGAARLRGRLTRGGNDGNACSVRIRTRPRSRGALSPNGRVRQNGQRRGAGPRARRPLACEVAGETSG